MTQNSALQIAIECSKIAIIDQLHEEFSMLTVKKHNELLTCYLSTHPNDYK